MTILLAVMTFISVKAYSYDYTFSNTPISEAIVRISQEHPEINISFIYKDLDNYRTSSKVKADEPYSALRQIIGLNPISVINKGNHYYIEALQHGKFTYFGKVIGEDNEPLVGVSVILLAPRDSTVITYGITNAKGRFSLPCDKKSVLAKFVCVGYTTSFFNPSSLDIGTVIMPPSPIRLSAVSVEANQTLMLSDKNIYIPTSRQKGASQDAADLLRRIAIPQLVINPADNSVKDVFGNSVAIYINSHEAQPDELKGMKMTDVRKIEYIEFPIDPRFKGAQRVVNFIVQEYEYGGYTKVSESFKTLNGLYNNTDLFSRFTYKKMTYDLYVGSDNQNYHHSGTDNSSIYHLENDGTPVTLTRTETFGESYTHINRLPVTLRATYNTKRFSVRNTLSFTHFAVLENNNGSLNVDIYPHNNYVFQRNNPSRDNSVYYHGNFWNLLGPNASWDITPKFLHTHRNNSSLYKSTLLQSPLYNIITENTYNWSVRANGRLMISQKNQLSLFLSGGQNINKLIYQGSNNIHDSYSNSFLGGEIRYRYQIQKFSITSFAGFCIEHNSMNGITTNDASPRVGVNLRATLSRESQIGAYLSYQTTTPDIDMKANDIVRSNEFMYLTANPNLKNWRNLNSNLSYNWHSNNSFSLAAFVGYDRDFNRAATVYEPYDNGRALLRNYVNNGSFIHYYAGISANYKLFNNSLQLYANLTQNAYEITGAYNESYYPFRMQVQAVYYWKSFNVLASWGNPKRSLTENSNYIIKGRNFHMLSLGYGNGIWTVNFSAKNIFNRGWKSDTWSKHSPRYDEYIQFFNPSSHASFNLSIAYTVGYGKKVKRENEVGGQSSAPSAIIK